MKKKYRILIDARGTQEGYKQHKIRGIGTYVHNLLSRLPVLTDEIEFTYLLDSSKPIDPQIGGLPVQFMYHKTPGIDFYQMQYFAAQVSLSKLLSKESFDLCHFATQDDAPFSPPGLVCVSILDTITISMKQLYGPVKQLKQAFVRSWSRRVVRYSAAVVTISEHSKKDIIKHFGVPADSIYVTYLGVDEKYFQKYSLKQIQNARSRFGLDQPYCLYIGGIDPRKNVFTLLEALAMVCRQKPDYPNLALVGQISDQREYPKLLRALHSLGIQDRVRLTGYVPEESLPALYAGAQYFIFPSLYEGFGLPVAEAMAAGTPVIASRNSSIPEVGGDAPLYVDVADPHSLASGMLALEANSSLVSKMRAKGKIQAKQFSWEETAQKTIDIYRRIIHQQGKGSDGKGI